MTNPVKRTFRMIVHDLTKKLVQLTGPISVKNLEQYNWDIVERNRKTGDWLKKNCQSFGDNVTIDAPCTVTDSLSLIIGNNVYIGPNTYFQSEAGLTIHDNVHIGAGVNILTLQPRFESDHLPHSKFPAVKPVNIEKNVFVGQNTLVLPGVTIGEGAIITPGSVISESIPPLALVGGQSSLITGYRDPAVYAALERDQRYVIGSYARLPVELLRRVRRSMSELGDSLFFVVSTGRSGSHSIAQSLSGHPAITCLHEPRRQMIRISTDLAHSVIDDQAALIELRAIYGSSTFPDGFYGESDHKYATLIPQLNEMFPKSKFVWQIRDGRKVVASWLGRGRYIPGHPSAQMSFPTHYEAWIYYHLTGDRCGAMSEAAWAALTPFEKNCWYWVYINEQIEQKLKQLSPDRWMFLRLENLQEQLPRLVQFIGAAPQPLTVQTSNRADYEVRSSQAWTPDEYQAFERIAGSAMDRWYSGWRKK